MVEGIKYIYLFIYLLDLYISLKLIMDKCFRAASLLQKNEWALFVMPD